MPHPFDVLTYWHEKHDDLDSHWIGKSEPFCFRCGWLSPQATDQGDLTQRAIWQQALCWLDRAHLVDRYPSGLDGVQNLVLLCRPCHKAMPEFGPNEVDTAKQWVFSGVRRPWLWQITTDLRQPADSPAVLRLWREFCDNAVMTKSDGPAGQGRAIEERAASTAQKAG